MDVDRGDIEHTDDSSATQPGEYGGIIPRVNTSSRASFTHIGPLKLSEEYVEKGIGQVHRAVGEGCRGVCEIP